MAPSDPLNADWVRTTDVRPPPEGSVETASAPDSSSRRPPMCPNCHQQHEPPAPLPEDDWFVEQGSHYLLLKKYHILKKISEGGFGTVFLAEHIGFQDKVAIKRLKPELAACPGIAQRFKTEAKVARKIKSEHVCSVLDADHDDAFGHCVIMEFLEGRPLSGYTLDHSQVQQPLPFWAVYRIVLPVLRGLQEIHQHGVVHRDLNPNNIFIIPKTVEAGGDGGFTVKILDFGIAKVPQHLRFAGEHQTVFNMGFPTYVSPEQANDMSKVDARSDIWAVGVVMYELLTGKPPYAEHPGAPDPHRFVLDCLLTETPVPPPQPIDRQVSRCDVDAVLAIICRCLEYNPNNRYSSVRELGLALRAVSFDEGPETSGQTTVGQEATPSREDSANEAEDSFTPVRAKEPPVEVVSHSAAESDLNAAQERHHPAMLGTVCRPTAGPPDPDVRVTGRDKVSEETWNPLHPLNQIWGLLERPDSDEWDGDDLDTSPKDDGRSTYLDPVDPRPIEEEAYSDLVPSSLGVPDAPDIVGPETMPFIDMRQPVIVRAKAEPMQNVAAKVSSPQVRSAANGSPQVANDTLISRQATQRRNEVAEQRTARTFGEAAVKGFVGVLWALLIVLYFSCPLRGERGERVINPRPEPEKTPQRSSIVPPAADDEEILVDDNPPGKTSSTTPKNDPGKTTPKKDSGKSGSAEKLPEPSLEKLEPMDLNRVLTNYKSDVEACRAAKSAPRGVVAVIKLKIEGVSGRVLEATPTDANAAAPCIAKFVKSKVRFPRFKQKVQDLNARFPM